MLALWRNWIVANVVGEIVGFGLAGAIMMGIGDRMVLENGDVQIALAAVVLVAMGLVEGTAVALAQFTVLGHTFPGLTRTAWLIATVAGAILAWACGMAIGQVAGDAMTSEMDVPIAGAIFIGALAGAILAGPQWLALRRAHVEAPWWIPAHVVAWSAGMVVAFAGVSAAPASEDLMLTMLVMAVTGLGMGGLVAAITGLALVDAARVRPSRSPALP